MQTTFVLCLTIVFSTFFILAFVSNRIGDILNVLRNIRINLGEIVEGIYSFSKVEKSEPVKIMGTLHNGSYQRVWGQVWDEKAKTIELRPQLAGKLRFAGCSGPALVTYAAVGQFGCQAMSNSMPIEALNLVSPIEVRPGDVVTIALTKAS
jgi:hypothetical protein